MLNVNICNDVPVDINELKIQHGIELLDPEQLFFFN